MMSSIPRTLQAWPPGRATQLIATPKTVDLISQIDPRVFQSLLPGQFTAKITVPEPYPDDTFTL